MSLLLLFRPRGGGAKQPGGWIPPEYYPRRISQLRRAERKKRVTAPRPPRRVPVSVSIKPELTKLKAEIQKAIVNKTRVRAERDLDRLESLEQQILHLTTEIGKVLQKRRFKEKLALQAFFRKKINLTFKLTKGNLCKKE